MPVSRSVFNQHFLGFFFPNYSIRKSNQIPILMQIRTFIEVEPPSPLRYLIGAVVMMIGVVLPVGYMMFRNKRVPSSSSYTKQTNKVLI
ncbi:unnamed protein product [Trifolium pratense]|uniref:Uncharacterized protein n=1 Tax=Trifolium pratense TaxID=57577 RepID=A0ACB0L6K1_TRIPR|nr:unnamed protein product [Trifolium pratense]